MHKVKDYIRVNYISNFEHTKLDLEVDSFNMQIIKRKTKFQNKGITLIALVVTVVVLLILAGVSINLVLGDNGIIGKTSEAKVKQEDASWFENAELILTEAQMSKNDITDMSSFLKEKFQEISNGEDVYVSKYKDGYIIIVGKRVITINSNFEITGKSMTQGEASKDWYFDKNSDGTCTLTGYKKDMTETIVIPSSAIDEDNGDVYLVTKLNSNIFNHATELKKVDFSNAYGLTEIGEKAFAFCEQLNITVPDDIPSSVSKIGNKAFYGCTNLTGDVSKIMSSEISLGQGVFMKCPNLTGNIQDIFNQNFYIDEQTGNPTYTEVEESQFSGYSGLTGSLVIPKYITKIGNNAFYGCSSISNLSFESGSQCTVIGDYAFYGDGEISNSLVIPNSVLTIGNDAFRECNLITGLTLSSNITTIGEYAFYNCYSISGTVTIPKTLTVLPYGCFWAARKISNVVFESSGSAGCTTISTYAFLSCVSLKTVTFPNTLKTIGTRAFDWGNALTSIAFPDSLETIGDTAFRGEKNMIITHWPQNLKTISGTAFQNCSSITTLPSTTNLVSIGAYAFEGCSKLGLVGTSGKTDIIDYLKSSKITNLGSNCFHNDTYLSGTYTGTIQNSSSKDISLGGAAFCNTSVTRSSIIPTGSITSIANNAYDGVTNFTNTSGSTITEITIPSTVTSIGNYAFSGCTSITKFIIPKSVTSIGTGAFMNCSALVTLELESGINISTLPNYMCYNDTKLSGITIPTSVKTIGDYSFSQCSSITTLVVPSNVNAVNSHAFEQTGITNLTLNEGLTTIKYEAFDYIHCNEIVIPDSVVNIDNTLIRNNSNLTKVTLGKGITKITGYLISGCPNLKTIIVRGTITRIENYAMTGDTSITLSGFGIDWSKVVYIGEDALKGCTSLSGTVKVDPRCEISEKALGNCPIKITK